MPLFADMIFQGMTARGHSVELWKPTPFFFRLPGSAVFKKWLGYLDQYIVFPIQVRQRIRRLSGKALFVFADQALGPWVPLVKNFPHVIHCHDFMALRSARGYFPQNPVSLSGRCYQALIHRGFCHGLNFISVSEKTRQDLEGFLPALPELSAKVYNGLNFPYAPMPQSEAARLLTEQGIRDPEMGFLLHVGGNQWYKNREGVLRIYQAYCERVAEPLPICLIGPSPPPNVQTIIRALPRSSQVIFLSGVSTQALQAAYSMARALIFPSISEGFGWPIAEAMACGCPVLTTDEAPMTEVGGSAACYVPVMPFQGDLTSWSREAAELLINLLLEPDDKKLARRRQSQAEVNERFSPDRALNEYELIYAKIFHEEEKNFQ